MTYSVPCDWEAVDWSLNDHAIAALLGCTHWTVARWRKQLGKSYAARNLYEFIRNNPGLFAPADVEWKRGSGKGSEYCNASAGLLNISGGKTKGWKGWAMGETEAWFEVRVKR